MKEALADLFARLVESLPALLIVLAAIFLVLGLAGGVTYHDFLPIYDMTPRVLAGVAAIVLAGMALYQSKVTASIALPKKQSYGITITRPGEGNHIGIMDVEGTIKRKLPAGYTLETLRIYPEGGFIPTGRAEVNEKTGTWLARGVNIGGVSGNSRIIGAYLVGPSSRAMFEYYRQANEVFKIARKQANMDHIYMPTLKYTEGLDMVECARVGVFRE